jgi:hypothetical protein
MFVNMYYLSKLVEMLKLLKKTRSCRLAAILKQQPKTKLKQQLHHLQLQNSHLNV